IFVLGERRRDAMRHALLDHLDRFALELFPALEREASQRVDDLALLVHDVVVVQHTLTSLEVLQLYPLFCPFNAPGDQRMPQHFACRSTAWVHETGDALGAEETQEAIFGRQEELR